MWVSSFSPKGREPTQSFLEVSDVIRTRSSLTTASSFRQKVQHHAKHPLGLNNSLRWQGQADCHPTVPLESESKEHRSLAVGPGLPWPGWLQWPPVCLGRAGGRPPEPHSAQRENHFFGKENQPPLPLCGGRGAGPSRHTWEGGYLPRPGLREQSPEVGPVLGISIGSLLPKGRKPSEGYHPSCPHTASAEP